VLLRDRQLWVWNHLPFSVRLLEVGCWDGRGTAGWETKTQTLYGIDVAAAVIDGDPQVIRAQASADHLPFPGAVFDAIVFSEVLEHLPSGMERAALEEIRRVITPKGTLLLTTPHRGWFAWLDPMDAKRRLRLRKVGHRHYSRDEIDELLAGLFRIDVFERSALILYAFSTALGTLNLSSLLRFRQRISDWEYSKDFGRASFNLMLSATPI
jgi:SAM-dependent methyltransferase